MRGRRHHGLKGRRGRRGGRKVAKRNPAPLVVIGGSYGDPGTIIPRLLEAGAIKAGVDFTMESTSKGYADYVRKYAKPIAAARPITALEVIMDGASGQRMIEV